MVDLKQSQGVDRLLSYLEAHWAEIPEIAEQWDTEMDSVDKEVFQMEWAIKEDSLERLDGQASTGKLTEEQVQRYKALKQLIKRRRPTLDCLFAST